MRVPYSPWLSSNIKLGKTWFILLLKSYYSINFSFACAKMTRTKSRIYKGRRERKDYFIVGWNALLVFLFYLRDCWISVEFYFWYLFIILIFLLYFFVSIVYNIFAIKKKVFYLKKIRFWFSILKLVFSPYLFLFLKFWSFIIFLDNLFFNLVK
jgi:hypothetical protein